MPRSKDRIPQLGPSIELTPEYRAAMGVLTAEEYLAEYGYTPKDFEPLRYGEAGDNPLWKKVPRKRRE